MHCGYTDAPDFFSTGVQTIVKAPVTAVIGIQRMSGADGMLAWATVIAVIVICIYLSVIIIKTIPLLVHVLVITDDMNRETKEHISGIQVIRAFLAKSFHRERFTNVNEKMRDVNIRLDRIMAFMSPGLVLILNMLNLAIVVIGAVMVSKTDFALRISEVSNILSYSSYAIMIVSAFVMMVQVFMILPRFITSSRRIKEVLDTDTEITDGSFEGKLPDTDTAIEFRNVCFRYSNDASNVIENISFKVGKGETVAIIGVTGSGKTTLANLIPRLYDVTEGSVLVNGVDIRERKIDELRNGIGYVPQKAMLFNGSIASNIDYGSNGKLAATLSEIKKATEVGQSKEFIENLNEKYNAPVLPSGSNFSGDQRQRLTISRAVCRDPEIYIFDDSLSALDFKTDRALRSKLRENAKGATFIIIAQRIGTIRSADRIVVLEKGAVVGIGTHSELLNSCDVYREIALSQLSEEEVAGI